MFAACFVFSSFECTRYSSNSYSYKFHKSYQNSVLRFVLDSDEGSRKTEFYLRCADNYDLEIQSRYVDNEIIKIDGASRYGCPVFQVSSIWNVFQDNWILIGLILMVIGAYLLFYGRETIVVTVFFASFFIVFGILGALSTVFISPYSSTFVVYFSFLLILFLSTIAAYLVTKILNISVFFIGACTRSLT